MEKKDLERQLEQIKQRLAEEEERLNDCVNELCYVCNKYENEHEGACDGCRWRDYRW